MPGQDLAQNKQIARSFLQAIAAGDIATISALLAADATWWVLGYGDLGREAFISALSATISRAASQRMDVEFVTAEDDRVAVAARGEFVFAEGAYRNTYHYLFSIAEGRIQSGREYLDTAIAAKFFGPGH